MAGWKGEIKTRRDGITGIYGSGAAVSIKLGGTTLWASDKASLDNGLLVLQDAVLDVASHHLTLVRSVFKKLVSEKLDAVALDDRLFSAVLGSVLRSGRMDSLICSSKNDIPFRVYIHGRQQVRWQKAIDIAMTSLGTKRILGVADLEAQIFGNRAYNTWSSAMHVLGHLSYRGVAQLLDDGLARIVDLI